MNKYNLHALFRQFPTLIQKKPKRILIRAILESLTMKEIGELITDCGPSFLNASKDTLSGHIETILMMIRKNKISQ